MEISPLHEWNLTPREALQLQKDLASQVNLQNPLKVDDLHLVAGVDVSVRRNSENVEMSQAAVVVMRYPSFEVVEVVRSSMPTPFPYIPGLLSFREGPVLVNAFQQLQNVPNVFIFDGMGIAHPRHLGIAAHLGLWLKKPTIGCGKTWLFGRHDPVGEERGSFSWMMDKNEKIGAAVRTRTRVKPVYISPGNLVDIESAIAVVFACTPRFRLPEPIRAAHNAAGEGMNL